MICPETGILHVTNLLLCVYSWTVTHTCVCIVPTIFQNIWCICMDHVLIKLRCVCVQYLMLFHINWHASKNIDNIPDALVCVCVSIQCFGCVCLCPYDVFGVCIYPDKVSDQLVCPISIFITWKDYEKRNGPLHLSTKLRSIHSSVKTSLLPIVTSTTLSSWDTRHSLRLLPWVTDLWLTWRQSIKKA